MQEISLERGVDLLPGPSSEWTHLAESAAVSNPFFEEWALKPALHNLPEGVHARVAVVRKNGHEPLGLLPLQPVIEPPAAIGSVWRVWSKMCFDTTPLVRAGHEEEFLWLLFRDIAQHKVRILRWKSLPLDTSFADALFEFLRRNGLAWRLTRTGERPLLRTDGGSGADLEGCLSRNRRRGLKRRYRRLRDIGQLDFRSYDGRHDADHWRSDFLTLESSGWKGPTGTGTALQCRPGERAFFEQLTGLGARLGRVIVHSLELDGRPIAMTVNYRAGEGLWAFKTAYDEKLARFSPGVLVEVEGSQAAMQDPSVRWFDSCTWDATGMMAELWPGRRPIGDLIIATAPAANGAVALAGDAIKSAHHIRRHLSSLLPNGRPRAHRSNANGNDND